MLTRGFQRPGESQLSAMSRKVHAVEVEIMRKLEEALDEHGYEPGTLIHDAILVQRGDGSACDGEDRERIRAILESTLAEIGSAEGWHVPLQIGVSRPDGA